MAQLELFDGFVKLSSFEDRDRADFFSKSRQQILDFALFRAEASKQFTLPLESIRSVAINTALSVHILSKLEEVFEVVEFLLYNNEREKLDDICLKCNCSQFELKNILVEITEKNKSLINRMLLMRVDLDNKIMRRSGSK
jgi:hypothetical protein